VPRGRSPEEVEWVRTGYRVFLEGDPAFLDRFAADAEIIIPPTLPAGGAYRSAFDAMEFWSRIGELFEDPNPEPNEFLRADDRLIVSGVLSATARASGEAIE